VWRPTSATTPRFGLLLRWAADVRLSKTPPEGSMRRVSPVARPLEERASESPTTEEVNRPLG